MNTEISIIIEIFYKLENRLVTRNKLVQQDIELFNQLEENCLKLKKTYQTGMQLALSRLRIIKNHLLQNKTIGLNEQLINNKTIISIILESHATILDHVKYQPFLIMEDSNEEKKL